MSRSRLGPVLVVAFLLAFAGCGDDDDGVTTPPPAPPPNVAGHYAGSWTLQVLRKSDGFQKQFECSGEVTLRQGGTSGSTAVMTGWTSAGSPCVPESYDLTGRVTAGGAVEFVADGPAPPEGPCPGGEDVRFSGVTTQASDGWRRLSVRGVTDVTCPQFGEHEFTYLVEVWGFFN